MANDTGHVIAGAPFKREAERIGMALVDHLPRYFHEWKTMPVEDFPTDIFHIDGSYLRALRRPARSMNWHLRQGLAATDSVSVIDWMTLLDDEDREQVMETLVQRFINSTHIGDVREKGDIPFALERCFPYVGRHVHRFIRDPIWEHVREHYREQLSEYSHRAVTNGDNGQAFEAWFATYCERNGLGCWKESSRAFWGAMPALHKQVKREMGGMTGIPDFFVDKGNTHTLGDWMRIRGRAWEPEQRYAFVEVKYNESRLSKEQRHMVETLIQHGLDVYLFKGTLDDYGWEKLSS